MKKSTQNRVCSGVGMTRLTMLLLFTSVLPVTAMAVGCGELVNGYGPYDYRKITEEQRVLVEGAHFIPATEALGGTKHITNTISGDIDYTLRAFPNNPRALLAMARYSLLKKTEKFEDANYTLECYFDRAFRMAPDDPLPHLVYSTYLKDRKRKPEALKQLEIAAALNKEISTYVFPYNMALGYVDLGVYDKAMDYARQAYQFGAPFPGLKNKLVAAGKWQEIKAQEIKEEPKKDAPVDTSSDSKADEPKSRAALPP